MKNNRQYVKLYKLKNEFVWLIHENEDELFRVYKDTLLMDLRDGSSDEAIEEEILIVPKGVEYHTPMLRLSLICFLNRRQRNIKEQ